MACGWTTIKQHCMKKKTSIKLPLEASERRRLRAHGVKIADLTDFTSDELEVLLEVEPVRARELKALAEFQSIPSIGLEFAKDLVFMNIFSIEELKEADGAGLTDHYEQKKGFAVDPCVEDQFRLIVHYAQTGDASRPWWGFTAERKRYRQANGYPAGRPEPKA